MGIILLQIDSLKVPFWLEMGIYHLPFMVTDLFLHVHS